jgi:tetratricopeptide (TPR) repeat protein
MSAGEAAMETVDLAGLESERLDSAARTARRSASHERRAAEQLAAALAATGRDAELTALLERFRGTAGEPSVRFYVALRQAAQDVPAALRHVEAVLASTPDHAAARQLAYRLLLREARAQVRRAEWQALPETLCRLVQVAPDDGNDADLAAFKESLPLAQLRTGNRREALRLWEERLRQSPGHPELIHSLALAYHWSVTEEESRDPWAAVDAWYGAIAYWTALSRHTAFWDRWNAERSAIWGHALSTEELGRLRSELVDAQLRSLQDLHSQAVEAQRSDDADRYEDFMLALLGEREAADLWSQAIPLIGPPSSGDGALLATPGGYAFFQRHERLDHVRAAIETLTSTQPDADCLPGLLIHFAPDGLGRALVQVELRHRPDEALAQLDKLPERSADRPEALYVRARALATRAHQASAQKSLPLALESWKEARRALKSLDGKRGGPFRRPAGKLLADVEAEVAATVQKEANRIKAKSLDQAIRLLEEARAAFPADSIREYLCIFYCDRGTANLGEKKLSTVRADFERALKLDPDYGRAKQGLSTTYNNEGCRTKNEDRSISLLEKAIEYDPNNHVAHRNLAMALKNKAVSIVNGLTPYSANYRLRSEIGRSIELLERAARLLNPKIDDEVLKGVLDDLATAYRLHEKIPRY